MSSYYDVVVVGAGHAGIEAALAAARMGCRTAVLSISLDSAGLMPCNCSIGGPAKGHVVREVDALGGQMALTADQTLTHVRMLNTGKGPAVQALRAQCDKKLYRQAMRAALEAARGLDFIAGRACDLIVANRRVAGVRLDDGSEVGAATVVITTGTFLRGMIHVGEEKTPAGRIGEPPTLGLADSLRRLGFPTIRLKTGTPPRVHKDSVDFSRAEPQPSDPDAPAFSFLTDTGRRDGLLPSWLTYTNAATKRVVADNLHLSAMYGGHIQGIGPRYCPSIEDKIVKFADRDSHQVFLEQEGWDADEIYVQGMSTSLPAEVQDRFLRTIPALEECVMLRAGYAVEYDAVPPTELTHSLMTRRIAGLFLAGQINGTSGYEEAAGQGLVAGANAALLAQSRAPLILTRRNSYIGVMIDDLVTKGVDEPYRLLTSRAEYRLLLRQDNADQRLTDLGRTVGLVDEAREQRLAAKRAAISLEEARLRSLFVADADAPKLAERSIAPAAHKTAVWDLLKRPQVHYDDIRALGYGSAPADVAEQVEISAKYDGYIRRQAEQIERAGARDGCPIPPDTDYAGLRALSTESRQKLRRVQPTTLGQAARVPGVTPDDVAVLAVHIEQRRRAEERAARTAV